MTKKYLMAALVFALACGGDERSTESPAEEVEAEAPETEVAEEAAPEEAAEAEPAPAGLDVPLDAPSREANDRFTVELVPQESYAAGTLGQVELRIAGAGEWHVNESFPFAVRAEGTEGLALQAQAFNKDAATTFSEESVVLAMPVTPSAGEHSVAAEVSFAICNPSTCVPTTLALRTAVVAE